MIVYPTYLLILLFSFDLFRNGLDFLCNFLQFFFQAFHLLFDVSNERVALLRT